MDQLAPLPAAIGVLRGLFLQNNRQMSVPALDLNNINTVLLSPGGALDLGGNQLSGSIPSEVGMLRNLTEMCVGALPAHRARTAL